ncbi:hypothetical protein [Secundilactobacillus kimchicus]|nr:hypothetical protein [Secundilactobacillus kimchicus]
MSDEDRFYANLAARHEDRKSISYEDSDLARCQEHEWEEEDNR